LAVSVRNPLKDKVAIVGIGFTEYGRHLQRTPLSLGLEAARKAITDAGIPKEEIDGICGSGAGFGVGGANFLAMVEALGIPELTWCMNSGLGASLVNATHAVFSGACDTALLVSSGNVGVGWSSGARNDPFRMRTEEQSSRGAVALRMASNPGFGTAAFGDYAQGWFHAAEPYAGWGLRYLHDFGVPRDVFGLVAINNRSNASRNDRAVLRTPITMDDYMNARMIRYPLGMLDLDIPCDYGEAIVVTTAERAKDLKAKPVYIHATTFGEMEYGTEYYENGRDYTLMSPWVAARTMWAKSDLTVDEVDVFFPYDGFTPISICHTEAHGWCKPGEAYDFFQQHWDKEENRLKVNGRVLFQPSGGSLSQGRGSGFNYFTEAVMQLRGEASNQVPDAKVAVASIGSYFHDPTATILRAE
jgi:acetyl-CoA acetyltransferase